MHTDIQNQRERYYNNFYLKDKNLKEMINFAVRNFDCILKSENPVKVDFDSLGYGLAQRVVVKKKIKPDVLVISAYLSTTMNGVGSLKCLLERRRIAGKLYANFVVSGFTIV